MLCSIYLGGRNSDLGVTSNSSWPRSSYKESLLAVVVVSTVSYQPITTHCGSFCVQKQQNYVSTDRSWIILSVSHFSLLMHGAAMLGSGLGHTEVPPSFWVGVLTSGGVPDDVSECDLGNSDFQDQMEHAINKYVALSWNPALDEVMFGMRWKEKLNVWRKRDISTVECAHGPMLLSCVCVCVCIWVSRNACHTILNEWQQLGNLKMVTRNVPVQKPLLSMTPL